MLLIFGLPAAWQKIVTGAAIIVGMLASGDRIASLLGRLLRRMEAAGWAAPRIRVRHNKLALLGTFLWLRLIR